MVPTINYSREALPTTMPRASTSAADENNPPKYAYLKHVRDAAGDLVSMAKDNNRCLCKGLLWGIVFLGLLIVIGLLAEFRSAKVKEGIEVGVQGNSTELPTFTELPFWAP